MADLLESCLVVGRADTSSAWVLSFFALHSWLAGLLPPEARNDLFATGPAVFAPATFSPTGNALRSDGADSYTVSGRWQWATGVCHSSWAMVTALVHDVDGGPVTDVRLFVVPMSDVTLHDTWTASGMRATGSHDISVEDLKVPATHSISFAALLDGSAAEVSAFEGPLGRWPLAAILALGAAAPALGAAWGTLERYEQRVGTRRLAYTGVVDAERGSTRARVARARVQLEATELLLLDTARRIDDQLSGDDREGAAALEVRAHARMVAAQTVATARSVVEDIVAASGASAQLDRDPLQRAHRDMATLGGHVVFDYDATAELYGAIHLGQTPPPGLL